MYIRPYILQTKYLNSYSYNADYISHSIR